MQDEPDGGATPPGPWADVPPGVRVGTLVHRALEAVDFAAPEFGAEVVELGAEAGLRAALDTPLGEPFGVRLADIAPRRPARRARVRAAAGRWHGGGAGRRCCARTAIPTATASPRSRPTQLRGFLTGSLDLVARLPDGRFAIFDYKTNGLGAYAPDALREEMHRRHYGLQALLYAVALHRYLRVARAGRRDRRRRLPVPARRWTARRAPACSRGPRLADLVEALSAGL